MSRLVYDKMYKKAIDVIKDDFKLKLSAIELVSGGAAWAGELAFYYYYFLCNDML